MVISFINWNCIHFVMIPRLQPNNSFVFFIYEAFSNSEKKLIEFLQYLVFRNLWSENSFFSMIGTSCLKFFFFLSFSLSYSHFLKVFLNFCLSVLNLLKEISFYCYTSHRIFCLFGKPGSVQTEWTLTWNEHCYFHRCRLKKAVYFNSNYNKSPLLLLLSQLLNHKP